MRSIINFILSVFKRENINIRNYALFLVILMCTQYIPLEGETISPVKVGVMGLTLPVLMYKLRVNNALVFGVLYMIWIFFTGALIHPESYRSSTVFYGYMFVITYITFYTFIRSYEVFTIDFFIRFLKTFIFVLVGVLVIQQLCIIVGIRNLPAINLHKFLDRGIGANSLLIEPSHFARIMLVLFYAYIKCNEYVEGEKISFGRIFSLDHRWVTLAFLWAMLTMGSGTAFVCLALLSLYFLRGWQLFTAVPLFIGIYFALSSMEVKQFERVKTVVEATSTGDANAVVEADNSASARIQPMLNTFNIDFTEAKSWIGEGCDSSVSFRRTDRRYLGEINDYGLIAYILGLILVFSSSIDFLSIATVMFFCGVGGGTANIPYQWGQLMILACVKNFSRQSKYKLLRFEKDEPEEESEEEVEHEPN